MEYANIFESAFPDAWQTGDVRATDVAHRKIQLQSPKDLTYLMANISRAARNKIDRDLPPEASATVAQEGNSGGEDLMRMRVEGLVDEYIRATFSAAKDNLCINGMDSAELDAELAKAREGEEIETFDSKLARRIQSLSSQIEAHTLALANIRRNTPASAAAKFHDSFTQAARAVDKHARNLEQANLAQARQTTLDIGYLDRLDDVQRDLTRGRESLADLDKSLKPTVARMEKARDAVDIIHH